MGKFYPLPESAFSSAYWVQPPRAVRITTPQPPTSAHDHRAPLLLAGPLSLFPWRCRLLTKRGSDLTVSAGPGCREDTHCPVEATEELGAIRGEAERVGCRQLILGEGKGWKQAWRTASSFSRKESWARASPGAGQSPYQVIIGAKGSPELSGEGIPDVNWVLPAAAGHAERDMDTEAPVLSKEGEEAN